MQEIAVRADDVERCREVMAGQAQRLHDISVRLAPGDRSPVDGPATGPPSITTRLGTACQQVHAAASAQLAAATQFLATVDQSLVAVGRELPNADVANADALVQTPTR